MKYGKMWKRRGGWEREGFHANETMDVQGQRGGLAWGAGQLQCVDRVPTLQRRPEPMMMWPREAA